MEEGWTVYGLTGGVRDLTGPLRNVLLTVAGQASVSGPKRVKRRTEGRKDGRTEGQSRKETVMKNSNEFNYKERRTCHYSVTVNIVKENGNEKTAKDTPRGA